MIHKILQKTNDWAQWTLLKIGDERRCSGWVSSSCSSISYLKSNTGSFWIILLLLPLKCRAAATASSHWRYQRGKSMEIIIKDHFILILTWSKYLLCVSKSDNCACFVYLFRSWSRLWHNMEIWPSKDLRLPDFNLIYFLTYTQFKNES